MTEPLPTFPPTATPAPRTGGEQGYLRIATEEAFATPEIIKLYDQAYPAKASATAAKPAASKPAGTAAAPPKP